MSETHGEWTRLEVLVHAPHHATLLCEGIGPFLMGHEREPSRRGYFIPDPESASISVYVSEQAGAEPRDSLWGLLRDRGLAHLVSDVHVTHGARTTIHDVQLQGPVAQGLIDRFLVETNGFVLERLAAPESRTRSALELMLAQPVALEPRLFTGLRHRRCPIGFVSYRSHADGFFIMTKDPAATKRAFDERYERTAMQTRRALEAIIRQRDCGSEGSSVVARWVELANPYIEAIADGLRSGELAVNMGDETGWLGDRYDLEISPFHAAVQADPGLRERAFADVDFNTMRVMASLLYLTLHRFGVRLIERYVLCHVVARTFEAAYEVGPVEAIELLSRELWRRVHGVDPEDA